MAPETRAEGTGTGALEEEAPRTTNMDQDTKKRSMEGRERSGH